MRTAITIEARMRSTRLPGKVLRPIMGRPMLELMIERLRLVKGADVIVIATTDHDSCDPIEELARELGVACYRGSEDDVLDRVLQAARSVEADVIVETTGDCPLIDPGIADQVIDAFHASDVDYCANILERTYPRGMDVQVFTTAVLADVASRTQDAMDHEHVSLYIYRHPEIYSLRNVESGLSAAAADTRLTVDTHEDLALITAIFEELYPKHPDFTLADILALLDGRPDLKALNADVAQKHV